MPKGTSEEYQRLLGIVDRVDSLLQARQQSYAGDTLEQYRTYVPPKKKQSSGGGKRGWWRAITDPLGEAVHALDTPRAIVFSGGTELGQALGSALGRNVGDASWKDFVEQSFSKDKRIYGQDVLFGNEELGISGTFDKDTNPLLKTISGLALDVAADPLSYVGGVGLARKGAETTAEGLVQGIEKAILKKAGEKGAVRKAGEGLSEFVARTGDDELRSILERGKAAVPKARRGNVSGLTPEEIAEFLPGRTARGLSVKIPFGPESAPFAGGKVGQAIGAKWHEGLASVGDVLRGADEARGLGKIVGKSGLKAAARSKDPETAFRATIALLESKSAKTISKHVTRTKWRKFLDVTKDIPVSVRGKVLDALEGDEAALAAVGADKVAKVRAFFDELAQEGSAEGLFLSRIDDYAPHMLTDEAKRVLGFTGAQGSKSRSFLEMRRTFVPDKDGLYHFADESFSAKNMAEAQRKASAILQRKIAENPKLADELGDVDAVLFSRNLDEVVEKYVENYGRRMGQAQSARRAVELGLGETGLEEVIDPRFADQAEDLLAGARGIEKEYGKAGQRAAAATEDEFSYAVSAMVARSDQLVQETMATARRAAAMTPHVEALMLQAQGRLRELIAEYQTRLREVVGRANRRGRDMARLDDEIRAIESEINDINASIGVSELEFWGANRQLGRAESRVLQASRSVDLELAGTEAASAGDVGSAVNLGLADARARAEALSPLSPVEEETFQHSVQLADEAANTERVFNEAVAAYKGGGRTQLEVQEFARKQRVLEDAGILPPMIGEPVEIPVAGGPRERVGFTEGDLNRLRQERTKIEGRLRQLRETPPATPETLQRDLPDLLDFMRVEAERLGGEVVTAGKSAEDYVLSVKVPRGGERDDFILDLENKVDAFNRQYGTRLKVKGGGKGSKTDFVRISGKRTLGSIEPSVTSPTGVKYVWSGKQRIPVPEGGGRVVEGGGVRFQDAEQIQAEIAALERGAASIDSALSGATTVKTSRGLDPLGAVAGSVEARREEAFARILRIGGLDSDEEILRAMGVRPKVNETPEAAVDRLLAAAPAAVDKVIAHVRAKVARTVAQAERQAVSTQRALAAAREAISQPRLRRARGQELARLTRLADSKGGDLIDSVRFAHEAQAGRLDAQQRLDDLLRRREVVAQRLAEKQAQRARYGPSTGPRLQPAERAKIEAAENAVNNFDGVQKATLLARQTEEQARERIAILEGERASVDALLADPSVDLPQRIRGSLEEWISDTEEAIGAGNTLNGLSAQQRAAEGALGDARDLTLARAQRAVAQQQAAAEARANLKRVEWRRQQSSQMLSSIPKVQRGRLREGLSREAFREVAVGVYIPTEMADAMYGVERITAPEGFQGLLRGWDRLVNWQKSWQVSTPGFTIRNAFGGFFNNALAGVGFKSYRDLRRLAWKAHFKPDTLTEAETALYDSIRTAVGSGQVGTEVSGGSLWEALHGQTKTRYLRPSTQHAIVKVGRRANEATEFMLRGALAHDVLTKGGSLEDATSAIFKFHFDYEDLGKVEQAIRKVIPFYVWTRRNIPLQVEQMTKNPRWFARYAQAKGEIERLSEEDGIVPDYFAQLGAIRLPFMRGGGHMYLIPDLPLRDLNRVTQPEDILSMVTPLVKTPIELYFNQQFFKKLPIKDDKFVPMPTAMKILTPALVALGAARRGPDGNYYLSEKAEYTLRSEIPFYAQLRRLYPSDKKGERKFASSVASYWGLPLRTNSLEEQEIARWVQSLDEQKEEAKRRGLERAVQERAG